MKQRTIITVSIISLFLLFASSAYAVGGGRVQGVLKFHNKLSHYCSNITEGLNCTGSKYNENAYDMQLPLSDVKIVMRINGVAVASGSTDINGNYDLNWYYPGSGSPTNAQIESFLEHKDGRFRVYSTGTTSYRIYGNFIASYDWIGEPLNAIGAIQNLGTWNWGTSTTPNDKINLYAAAWRTWYYAFKYSGVLLSNFGDGSPTKPSLKIVANSSGSDYSSYSSSNHRVTIGTVDVNRRSYQAVYHEMGHAASFKASKGTMKTTIAFKYPDSGQGGSHSYNTPEWSSGGFEEGLVDFLGVVGQYWYNAPEARACLTVDGQPYCLTSVPAGQGVRMDSNPSCTLTNENRFQRNTTRFLWDYYDSNNEGSDTITGSYWQFLSALNAMADGTGNNQTNEPWNAAKTEIDDYDGRSLLDLRHMLYDLNGVGSYSIYTMHCLQPGSY